jgi:tetratricopeptide (TPR) repeat protein
MDDPDMLAQLADLGEPKVAKAGLPAAGGQQHASGARKGGGAKAYALVGFVGVVLFGVYTVQSGMLGAKDPANSASVQSAATAQPLGAQSGDATMGAPPGTEAAVVGAPDPPQPGTAASEAPEQPAEDDHVEARGSSGAALENPFKRDETPAMTCEALLEGNVPQKGPDPVSEASAIWDQARGAIVGGKLEQAHRFMCEAVKINPESAAVEGLAAHYLIVGAYSQALRWANQAEALRPGQKDIRNLLGDVYAMMGDVPRARDMWLQLLNIAPDESARIAPISKDYSVEAGRHLRRGDLARAEVFYRRAVILDPENLNGLLGLAKVYHRMEMPRYTRAFCDMTLKLSDVIPEVHVLLGELSLSEGNMEDARARFERALAVRPDFFPAKRGLAQVK